MKNPAQYFVEILQERANTLDDNARNIGKGRRFFWSKCCPFALILMGVFVSLTGIHDVFKDSFSVDWLPVMLGVPWLVIGVVLALLLPGAFKNQNK